MIYDLVVIGGGPAGLAAANEAFEKGLKKILILERDKELGGILNQCIHNGFGLHHFKEELTGPEYASRFIEMLKSTDVEVSLNTMVLEITKDRMVHAISKKDGYRVIEAKTIILAMGCRERTRGAIAIPGTRPAGVFTAGAAQRYVNMEGYMVGKRVVILGSGDIGLIMARRMTLEGAKVLACVEVMPYSGGLNRNIVQCLNDYDIPLYLSHTIVDIKGKNRVEGVTVAEVDANRRPIPGTEMEFDCDTVLLSVGLIPENELTNAVGITMDRRTNGAVVYENMETSIPGVFACGNVVHVHDLVDFVTAESQRAGAAAAKYVMEDAVDDKNIISVSNGDGVTYTVPQKIRNERVENAVKLFFRVNRVCGNSKIIVKDSEKQIAAFKREHLAPGEMEQITIPKKLLDMVSGDSITVKVEEEKMIKELICIVCPKGCHLKVDTDNGYSVTGNNCERGAIYGHKELTAPTRVVTSTVAVDGGIHRRCSVKTDSDIPKEKIADVMEEINKVRIDAPVSIGQIIIADVCGTGANVVATRNV